jgi:hypothetical protein
MQKRFAFVLIKTPQKHFLYNIPSKQLKCSVESLVSCDQNKRHVLLNTEASATQSWEDGIPGPGRVPGPHKSTQRRTVVAIGTSSSEDENDSVK